MVKHKGTEMLETERLILRRFTIDDADAMFNNWANDPEVTKYLTWLPHGKVDITRNLLESWIKEYEDLEKYNWTIVLKNIGKPIGSISVVEASNIWERAEIGYCMGKKYWNQGIMTESLKAVVNYLITQIGFKRIQATHHVDNPASGKVMLKTGMKYEGRLRKYIKNNQGQFVDCDMYAILDEHINLNE